MLHILHGGIGNGDKERLERAAPSKLKSKSWTRLVSGKTSLTQAFQPSPDLVGVI